jgi:hypothetical protein
MTVMNAFMSLVGGHKGRRRLAALAAAMVVASAAAAAPLESADRAVPHFDGMWSVLIVTEKGDCDRGYRYPIRISHGVLGNAGDAAFTISGKVAPSGAINVTVSRGSSSANGSGRLAGNSGEGSWTGGQCSGTWSAERRSS